MVLTLAVRVLDTCRLGRPVWVDAIEGDSISDRPRLVFGITVCHVGTVVNSLRTVARHDPKARWERNSMVDIVTAAFVVDQCAVVVNVGERSISVLVVQQRRPIHALVLLDRAGGTRRCL